MELTQEEQTIFEQMSKKMNLAEVIVKQKEIQSFFPKVTAMKKDLEIITKDVNHLKD